MKPWVTRSLRSRLTRNEVASDGQWSQDPISGPAGRGDTRVKERRVTWAARTEAPNGKTSPEELVAAAHASCFAMALALVLGKANATPEQLVVRALCTLDEVAGAPRITRSARGTWARVQSRRGCLRRGQSTRRVGSVPSRTP
jgi:organic hydroperoxide reductase OsmC/OhrA